MFDLEKAISGWKKTMRRSPTIDDGDLAELERYLRDKVEDLACQGLSPEEAFRTAEAEFLRAGAIDAAYGHVRAAKPRGRFPWRPQRYSRGLLQSYIKTALRRVRLQKTHSLINIGGLALGLAACLLAFLWVQDEVGYDRFQERADSIAQVYNTFDRGEGPAVHMGSFFPLAAALKAECPEVVEAARVQGVKVPTNDSTTRLIARMRSDYNVKFANTVMYGPPLVEPISCVMQRKMLLGIKQQVETAIR